MIFKTGYYLSSQPSLHVTAMELPHPQDMVLDSDQDTPSPFSPCLERAIMSIPLTSTHPKIFDYRSVHSTFEFTLCNTRGRCIMDYFEIL